MGQTINPFGKDIVKVETEFCGRPLSLEVNRIGFRTNASVLVRYGDTVIMGTAMVSDKPITLDYFPLSIDYEEKFYAAGKISGSRFIKREGKPSDEAVLIGRLIDRPIRPLWPKGYRHEVQGVATVLSLDPNFRPDAIAMIAVSMALRLTGAPFDGPVAGVRVGLNEGKPTAFMEADVLSAGKLDLFVAGTKEAIMMVEAGANEVSEKEVAEALRYGHEAIQPALKLQQELVEKIGIKPLEHTLSLPSEDIQKEVDAYLDGKMGGKIRAPLPERHELMHELRESMLKHFEEKLGAEPFETLKTEYEDAFAAAANKDVRRGILEDDARPDGRGFTDIRPLSSLACIRACSNTSTLRPWTFMSICSAVIPWAVPATLKSMSPAKSSASAMSLKITCLPPSLINPIAIPLTGALSGTPASINAKQLEQVAAMLVLPFWLIISVTERIAYGKSFSSGNTGIIARSAKALWPISRRPGAPRRRTSPTV